MTMTAEEVRSCRRWDRARGNFWLFEPQKLEQLRTGTPFDVRYIGIAINVERVDNFWLLRD